MAGGTIGLYKKKDLAHERYPSGSDEGIERDESEVPDEIRDSNDEIYLQ